MIVRRSIIFWKIEKKPYPLRRNRIAAVAHSVILYRKLTFVHKYVKKIFAVFVGRQKWILHVSGYLIFYGVGGDTAGAETVSEARSDGISHQSSPFGRVFFRKNDTDKSKIDIPRRLMQIIFRKKIDGLPWDINNERTNDPSMIWLRTKPMIRGAGSYSNFLIKYPTIPKMIMMKTSTILLLIV